MSFTSIALPSRLRGGARRLRDGGGSHPGGVVLTVLGDSVQLPPANTNN